VSVFSYERILSLVVEIPKPQTDSIMHVEWLDDNQSLGLTRDFEGKVSIFFVGTEVTCTSSKVAQNLTYTTWFTQEGVAVSANKLILPKQDHFDAYAAFICTLLIGNGIFECLQESFSKTEPVIELALNQHELQTAQMIGLLGELFFLRSLFRAFPNRISEVFNSWQGHERSSRDFSFQYSGVEVKTTRSLASRHSIQGFRQVEPGFGRAGIMENLFYLLSIGLEPVKETDDQAGAFSLPSIVEEILSELVSTVSSNSEITSQFLKNVESYGGSASHGYRHNDLPTRMANSSLWRVRFTRAYDMSDSRINVLRSHAIQEYSMVVSDSVKYEIQLPNQIEEGINPVEKMEKFISEIGSNESL
jgi:hypothetical protein